MNTTDAIINPTKGSRLETLRTALIFAALIFICLYGLGDAGLIDPDEGRYAEIPHNMITTGDYVTPRLNDLKYFEKPPLCYWMTAAAFTILGESNFAARLTSALFALIGIAATWIAANKMYDRKIADWSAVVLGTSWFYYAIGRVNILDIPFAALVTLTLASAWNAQRERGGSRWLAVLYISGALSVLTKGLAGIVLPGGVLLCYALIARRPRLILTYALFWPGWILFFAILMPWFYLVSSRNPDFLYFFFVHEHFLRYSTTIHERSEPFWFFLPIVAAGMVPWAGFLPGALRDAFGRVKDFFASHDGDAPELFLLSWFLFILIFFSASGSKLAPYVTPALPPLAILIGRALRVRSRRDGRQPGIAVALLLNNLVLIALIAALVMLPRYFRDARYDLPLAYITGLSIAACLCIFVAVSLVGLRPNWSKGFALLVAAASILTAFALQPIQSVIAARRSVYELCMELKQTMGPDDIIINYRDFIHGLPYYLDKRIVIVEYTGELAFGKNAEPEIAREIFLTEKQFAELIETPTSGDKILVFEDEDYTGIPAFVGRGATLAAASHNHTAVRLRRK